MTLKAAVSPAESLTNFRSRVNLPEASTSPVEVLLGVEEEDGAAVDGKVQLRVEVAGAVVGQEGQLVPELAVRHKPILAIVHNSSPLRRSEGCHLVQMVSLLSKWTHVGVTI